MSSKQAGLVWLLAIVAEPCYKPWRFWGSQALTPSESHGGVVRSQTAGPAQRFWQISLDVPLNIFPDAAADAAAADV